MNKQYKIVVAHPNKQHSFALAKAVKLHGSLFKYITTVYDRTDSFTSKIKKLLKGNNLKKADSRKTNALDNNEIIQFCEIKGLIFLALTRVPYIKNIVDRYHYYLIDVFGKKVANYAIENDVDAVIMFDYTAEACFEVLKKKAPHIKRILDVTIVSRPYMYEIFKKDVEIYNDKNLLAEEKKWWTHKSMTRFKNEIALADYHFAASEVVKKSLKFCDVDQKKICHIPYGTNISRFKRSDIKIYSKPLRLIFVGHLSYRKGIHHLLKVVAQYSAQEVVLTLVGGYDLHSKYYLDYKDCENIIFKGFITQDILAEEYQQADVFILPSLSEGLAQVGLEAMGCGLPLICSEASGVNDIIINEVNGLVIPISDEKAIERAINWFSNNSDKIPQMSIAATQSVQNYGWESYEENIKTTLDKIMVGS